MIPRIFCVTLKDSIIRKNYIKEHFEKNNIKFDFFEGIDGKKFGLATNIMFSENDPSVPNKYIQSGRIGCLLSHYMLWKTLSYLPDEEFLIIEDDIILQNDFINKFSLYKSQLPTDWQYVFVGYCCLPNIKNITKINNNIIKSNPSPLCTHAYMIKKSAIEILLETNHQAWAAIDIQIQQKSLPLLNNYIFFPPLIDQLSLILQKNPSANIDSSFKSLTLEI